VLRCGQPAETVLFYLFLFSLDLKTLFVERVEILMRVVPNEQEVKAFKEYERDRKPTSLLSEEDRFMISVSEECIIHFFRHLLHVFIVFNYASTVVLCCVLT
jgi:hypothetical protein